MELNRLEKYKKQYKYFKKEINSLQNYLTQLDKKTEPIETINPNEVSQALHISEFDAIFLLSLAEREHLVNRRFLVYSKDHNDPLGDFGTSEEIPPNIVNLDTGREVYKDNYYIDIIFEIA